MKRRIAKGVSSPSLCLTHYEEWQQNKRGTDGCHKSCRIPCCWGASSKLKVCSILFCSSVLRRKGAKPHTSSEFGGNEKLSHDSLWEKIGKQIGDDLGTPSHRPATFLNSWRIIKHSVKIQISCGSSLCLCGYLQGCQGASPELSHYRECQSI